MAPDPASTGGLDAHVEAPAFLVVEDDVLVARALDRVLSRHAPVEVAESAGAALARIERSTSRTWLGAIVDVGLPDGSGIDLVRRFTASQWGLPTLVISGTESRMAPADAVAVGALFAFKPVSTATIDAFVERALEHRPQARIDRAIRMLSRGAGLSDREHEIVRHASRGVPRAELARVLGVSENTVKTHVRHVLAKTRAESLEAIVSRLLRGAVG